MLSQVLQLWLLCRPLRPRAEHCIGPCTERQGATATEFEEGLLSLGGTSAGCNNHTPPPNTLRGWPVLDHAVHTLSQGLAMLDRQHAWSSASRQLYAWTTVATISSCAHEIGHEGRGQGAPWHIVHRTNVVGTREGHISPKATRAIPRINHFSIVFAIAVDQEIAAHASQAIGAMSGTSMATPLVSGALALLRSSNMQLSAVEAADVITCVAARDAISGLHSSTANRLLTAGHVFADAAHPDAQRCGFTAANLPPFAPPPPPALPSPPSPPSPPYLPPGICTEACNWSTDGDCDDGGLGAEFSECACMQRPEPTMLPSLRHVLLLH